LRRMVCIRLFEEEVIRLAERGEIVGAAHSYIGEEAVAVGGEREVIDWVPERPYNRQRQGSWVLWISPV
ncbi:MAG: hypothetical protein V3T78_08010, partial [Dehalococcoidia bacterium]